MDEQKTGGEKGADDSHENQDRERGEQEQRPKDLDPKDQTKDVKGGGYKFI